jgi:micrococcal nuclease
VTEAPPRRLRAPTRAHTLNVTRIAQLVARNARRIAPLLLLAAPGGCTGADQEMTPREQPAAQSVPDGSAYCTIARVGDGDSFTCDDGERVRMLLVDAPELAQRPWGDSARTLARQLLPVGARVRLELDVRPRDPYGRLLAYVYNGDVFVNRELVRRGIAVVIVFQPNVRRIDTIRAAADSARAERRGLWNGSAFDCSPASFRARRCS